MKTHQQTSIAKVRLPSSGGGTRTIAVITPVDNKARHTGTKRATRRRTTLGTTLCRRSLPEGKVAAASEALGKRLRRHESQPFARRGARVSVFN